MVIINLEKGFKESESVIWTNFKEYANETSIHGLKFLTASNITWIERLWWLITVVGSFGVCSYLIKDTWNEWDQNPIITSFDNKPTSVFKIPFPAVTVCPLTKTLRTEFNFTDLNNKLLANNITDDEFVISYKWILQGYKSLIPKWRTLRSLSIICDDIDYKTEDIVNDTFIEFVKTNALQRLPTIRDCNWNNYDYKSCGPFFATIMTSYGLCYSLNILKSSEIFKENVLSRTHNYLQHDYSSTNWTIDNGYLPSTKVYRYPIRGVDTVKFTLRTKKEDVDDGCTRGKQGYQLFFHSPAEIPTTSHTNILVPHDQDILISVKPNMVITSENLQNYKPERRKCYYSSEKPLKYFTNYTRSNCEYECIANYTLHVCGCVWFHMPYSTNTPICGNNKKSCWKSSEAEYHRYEQILKVNKDSAFDDYEDDEYEDGGKDDILFPNNVDDGILGEIKDSQDDHENKNSGDNSNDNKEHVSPNNKNNDEFGEKKASNDDDENKEDKTEDEDDDENDEYDDGDKGEKDEDEISEAEWAERRKIIHQCNCLPSCTTYTYDVETFPDKPLKDDETKHVTTLTIYMKELEIIATKRSELYGQTDFLANVGGLIGLCLGFSLFSIVEVLYYLIRVVWGIMKNNFLQKKEIKRLEKEEISVSKL